MNIFGWITPRGAFFECPQYAHLKDMEKHPEAKAILEGVSESVAAVYESCEATAAEGEHPEWHLYEIAATNADATAREALLKSGFLRVGQLGNALHFEGTGAALADKMQKCKDLSESYGCRPVFERKG